MLVLICLLLFVLAIVFIGRFLATMTGPQNALEQKLDDLANHGFDELTSWDVEMFPGSYRVQRVLAAGYEGHTILLTCLDKTGYWSTHYDPKGDPHETLFVPFKAETSKVSEGTAERKALPDRPPSVDTGN